jgi:glycosyltransferase involved in cell wall biosynthesis
MSDLRYTMVDLSRFTMPTVGIVICTYKRPQSLKRVLDNLAEQKHTDFEHIDVCVVNDGSHDEEYEAIDFGAYPFSVSYLARARHPENRPQVYSSKNIGVENVTGDVLWLVDDDLVFDDHTLFILRLYHMLLADARPVIVPHYADKDEPWHYQNPFPFQPQPPTWDKLQTWVSFAGTSVRREDWARVGGVDLDYDGAMGFADLDLGIRLWKDGCCVIQADGLCCHIDDKESGGSHRDRFLYNHRNGKLFISKHPDFGKYGLTDD